MESRAYFGQSNLVGNGREYLRAVMNRDRSFDGAFVFGVSSTGIYCRPSCPARRPRVDRVLLFPSPDAAESSGFRGMHEMQAQAGVAARWSWSGGSAHTSRPT